MKSNKKLMILFCLVQCIFSKEADFKLKTSFSLKPEFKRKEDQFKYNQLSYDLKLLDLNVKFNKIDLNTGIVIKSKRDNIQLDDWDNDIKHLNEDIRAKSHDIMSKIYLKYISPEFYGLKYTGDLKYYFEDFRNVLIKKDKKSEKKYEYIEDDGKKQELGNIIFENNIKGKVKDSSLDFGFAYKANQFDRFDKDESYIKGHFNLDQNILDKANLDFKYKGIYDLNFSNTKFDPHKTSLLEFPDTMGGNYVHKLDNTFDIKFKHYLNEKNKKEVIGFDSNLEINSLLLAGEKKGEKLRAAYNYFTPKLDFYFKKQIFNNFYIIPKFKNEFVFKYSQNYPETNKQVYKESLLAYYSPNLELGLNNIKEFKEKGKIENTFILGYGQDMNIYPYFSKKENVIHKTYFNNKMDFNYKINEKLKVDLKSDINLNLKIKNSKLMPSSDKIKLDFKIDYKALSNLDLNFDISNNFSLTNKERILNPNDFKEEFSSNLGIKYLIFENKDKEKLNLDSKIYMNLKSNFNYYAKNNDFSFIRNKIDNHNLKLVYFGNVVPVSVEYTLGLKNKLEYEKNLNELLKINSGLTLDTNIEILRLTKEKMYHFKVNKTPKHKMEPLTSDYRNIRHNVGGKINIEPFVKLKYSPVKNLDLNFGYKNTLEFKKEVINIIKDDKRPDNGQYSYIDKEFKISKLNAILEFGLEYSW